MRTNANPPYGVAITQSYIQKTHRSDSAKDDICYVLMLHCIMDHKDQSEKDVDPPI